MTIQSITIRVWTGQAAAASQAGTSAAAGTATATPAANAAVQGGPAEHARGRHGCCQPGRSHVAQALHQLNRQVRHAIKDALRDMDELPAEGRQELVELAKQFRNALHETFHDAGRGREFDREAVADQVRSALQDLLAGLEALRAKYAAPAETAPAEPAPAGTTPAEDGAATKLADPVSPADPSALADAAVGFSGYA